MAAPNGYPSWAYNSAGQPAVIVTSLTQFNALPAPGTWSATPFPPATTPSAPYDTFNNGTGTMQVTDIRLQQQLVEARVANDYFSVAASCCRSHRDARAITSQ